MRRIPPGWRWVIWGASGALFLSALDLVLGLGLNPIPYGNYQTVELCPSCGKTRTTSGLWIGTPGCHVYWHSVGPKVTPVATFLAALDRAPHPHHAWRPYRSESIRSGWNGITCSGTMDDETEKVLPQESQLAGIDPALAAQAVRDRLEDPRFDGRKGLGHPPPWFLTAGWPPSDRASAALWWASAPSEERYAGPLPEGAILKIGTPRSHHESAVHALAFSPDGRILATAGGGDCDHHDSSVRLWATSSGKPIRSLPGHRQSVRSVAFSPDGTRLASGSWDGTVLIWDPASGSLLKTLASTSSRREAIYGLAISTDGTLLAAGTGTHGIQIWNLESGQRLTVLNGHGNTVSSVAFSKDGKTLLSGSWDGTLRLWDTAGWTETRRFEEEGNLIWATALSPDGILAASGGHDQTLRSWETATGNLKLSIPVMSGINSIAFSPDGRLLATGHLDGTLRLRESASGKEIRAFHGHASAVYGVAFSPDGTCLASGSADQNVLLWRVPRVKP